MEKRLKAIGISYKKEIKKFEIEIHKIIMELINLGYDKEDIINGLKLFTKISYKRKI